MSLHHGKLLELLAIENESNYQFLHIKLSFSEDIEILWKIDDYTADNLKTIAKFNGKYKYRLSLKSSWDNSHKRYISELTRTYLDRSERVYFFCSESYTDQLASIKSSHGTHDLDSLNFTSTSLEPLETSHLSRRPKKSAMLFRILIYIFLLVICFLLSTLLGYLILAMI